MTQILHPTQPQTIKPQVKRETPQFFDPAHPVGRVRKVTVREVQIAFNDSDRPPSAGEYLVIDGASTLNFSRINEMRLASIKNKQFLIGTVSLLSSISKKTGVILDGVQDPPSVGSSVFRALPEAIRFLSEGRHHSSGQEENVRFNIANLRTGLSTLPFSLTPETLYGRHIAVLGTTGSGKSWSLARIVEEAARFNSKVILFDASGEFSTMGSGAVHVYIGNHPSPPKLSQEVVLPYYQLKESDLVAIFQPTGQAQAPKLRAAMKSLKLALLSPNLALDGTIIKANKNKLHFEQEYFKHVDELEKSEANFDINHLVKQIQNECVNPYRSATEPHIWGDINGLELSLCTPLVNRIQDITHSANLAPIFNPRGKSSLLEVIQNFIDHPQARVLCVSLEYLSFAHSAREIVANAVGRYLLDIARGQRFREKPLLVIVDEAHQFLNTNLENTNRELSMDAFGMIAKEGRKYALSICLSTQRPRDIPESVLSQMGTMVVHRLINERDLSVIEKAAGAADKTSLETLPTLAAGDAIIIGADFPTPLPIRVIAPATPPQSRGSDFQKHWGPKRDAL